jgi:hypothetical protein
MHVYYGQLAVAKHFLGRGADWNWIGYDCLTALDEALRSGNGELVDWLRGQDAKSAKALA